MHSDARDDRAKLWMSQLGEIDRGAELISPSPGRSACPYAVGLHFGRPG